MASFGEYEIVDELYRTPFGCVCSAKPVGSESNGNGRATDYVVKLYEPAREEGQGPDEAGAREFLKRARLQQQVAKDPTHHWARVHDLGVSDAKPYYITDYYSRSAQKLIAGKVVLNPAALHEIVTAVSAGLAELEKVCQRHHGSLKPSNVLIGGSGDVSGARIVLADPICDSADGPSDPSADMFALGGLIYQLVMHRPFRQAAWPIDPSEEWKRLRGAGEKWRFLCSNLLNPDPKQRPDHTALNHSLAELAPSRFSAGNIVRLPGAAVRRVPFKKIAIVAGVLVVGAAGTGAYYHWMIVSTRAKVLAAHTQWLDPLLTDARTLQTFAQIAGPVVAPEERTALEFSDDSDWRKQYTPAGLRDARAAEAVVAEIHQRLNDVYQKSQEQLRSIQKQFERDEYVQASQFVAAVIDAPQPDEAHLVEAINARLTLAAQLKQQMRPTFVQFAADVKALESSSSADLRAFAAALEKSVPQSAVLKADGTWSLQPDLDAIAQQIRAIPGWPDQFDRTRFLAEQKSLVHLDNPALADVQQWLKKAGAYRYAEKSDEIAAAVNQLNQQLTRVSAEVEQELKWTDAKNPQATAYYEQKKTVEKWISQFSTAKFVASDFPENFNKKKTAVASAIDALHPTVEIKPPDVSTWIARMRETKFNYPPVQAFWTAQLQSLPAIESLNPDIVSKIETLRTTLQRLNVADFDVPSQLAKAPWQQIVEQRRNQRLGDILTIVERSPSLATPIVVRTRNEFKEWSDRIVKLAADFPIPQGAVLDVASIKAIQDKWSTGPDKIFWDDEVIGGSLGKVIDADLQRIDRLQKTLALSDPAKLKQTAVDGNQLPEIVLAAWSGLTTLQPPPPNPTDAIGLQEQARLIANVRSAVEKLPPESRPKRLNELQASATDAWLSVVKNARNEESLAAAVSLQPTLGVTDLKSLTSTDQFNLALCQGRIAVQQKDNAAVDKSAKQLLALYASLSDADKWSVKDLAAQLPNDAATAFASKNNNSYLWPGDAPRSQRELAFAQTQRDAMAKQLAVINKKIQDARTTLDEQSDPVKAKALLDGIDNPDVNKLRNEIQSLIDNRDKNYALGLRQYGQRDFASAFRAFLDAAHGGDPRGMLSVGGSYRSNQGVPQNLAEAEKWFKRAADKNLPMAMIELGTLSQEQRNPDQANKWFMAAANAAAAQSNPSDIVSLLRLAKMKLDGTWTGGPALATALQKVGSDPTVMTALGEIALDQNDVSTAGDWLAKADDKDAARSIPQLTGLLRRTAQSLETRNRSDAIPYYRRAADRGDITSMAAIGRIALDQGDTKAAADWIGKADATDSTHKVEGLGPLMARLGAIAVAHKSDSAYDWYRRAANRGDTTAQSWIDVQDRLAKSGSVGKETSGPKSNKIEKDVH